MSNQGFQIRPAQDKDIPGIYALVEELAIYEKARNELWLTVEEYQQLWEENAFESIVATHNDQVVGTCIYYMTFSTWKGRMLYLEDFVVKDTHRQTGIGQALFDEFISIAKTKECALIKWQVLDWNEPALAFYRKNQAIIEKEWWNGKIVFTEST